MTKPSVPHTLGIATLVMLALAKFANSAACYPGQYLAQYSTASIIAADLLNVTLSANRTVSYQNCLDGPMINQSLPLRSDARGFVVTYTSQVFLTGGPYNFSFNAVSGLVIIIDGKPYDPNSVLTTGSFVQWIYGGNHTISVGYYYSPSVLNPVNPVLYFNYELLVVCPLYWFTFAFFTNAYFTGSPILTEGGYGCQPSIAINDTIPTGAVSAIIEGFKLFPQDNAYTIVGQTDQTLTVDVDNCLSVIGQSFFIDMFVNEGTHIVRANYNYGSGFSPAAMVNVLSPSTPTCPDAYLYLSYMIYPSTQPIPPLGGVSSQCGPVSQAACATSAGLMIDYPSSTFESDYAYRLLQSFTLAEASTIQLSQSSRDGSNIYIDDRLALVSMWNTGTQPLQTWWQVLDSGPHRVRIEFFELSGDSAFLHADVRPLCPVGTWSVIYYNGTIIESTSPNINPYLQVTSSAVPFFVDQSCPNAISEPQIMAYNTPVTVREVLTLDLIGGMYNLTYTMNCIGRLLVNGDMQVLSMSTSSLSDRSITTALDLPRGYNTFVMDFENQKNAGCGFSVSSACEPHPCLNDGICSSLNTTNRFSCSCKQGWWGPTCANQCPYCAQPGSMNLGCSSTGTCTCFADYTGANCETKISCMLNEYTAVTYNSAALNEESISQVTCAQYPANQIRDRVKRSTIMKWIGNFTFPYNTTYLFTAGDESQTPSANLILFIDNQPIWNSLNNVVTASVDLQAGIHQVELDFIPNTDAPNFVDFFWLPAYSPATPIPVDVYSCSLPASFSTCGPTNHTALITYYSPSFVLNYFPPNIPPTTPALLAILTGTASFLSGYYTFPVPPGSPLSSVTISSLSSMVLWSGPLPAQPPILLDGSYLVSFSSILLAPYNTSSAFTWFSICWPLNPCQNGGECTSVSISNFTCTCTAGYGGVSCELPPSPCLSSPCTNGAACFSDASNSNFTCVCASGFYGLLCEADLNECLSNPCASFGTCNNMINGFSCSCDFGYTGPLCEKTILFCESSPCMNDGVCLNSVGGFSCVCPAGINGTFCEDIFDECNSFPCQNQGVCQNELNSFSCLCSEYWTGPTCELSTVVCESSPCQNGATCIHLNAYTCICAAGFNGVHCENDINECDSNPCASGATCHNLVNRYECSCPPLYTGGQCQSIVQLSCDQVICENDAACYYPVPPNGFFCQCLPSYSGLTCATLTNPSLCGQQPIFANTATSFETSLLVCPGVRVTVPPQNFSQPFVIQVYDANNTPDLRYPPNTNLISELVELSSYPTTIQFSIPMSIQLPILIPLEQSQQIVMFGAYADAAIEEVKFFQIPSQYNAAGKQITGTLSQLSSATYVGAFIINPQPSTTSAPSQPTDANPTPDTQPTTNNKSDGKAKTIIIVATILGIAVVLVAAIVGIVVIRKRQRVKYIVATEALLAGKNENNPWGDEADDDEVSGRRAGSTGAHGSWWSFSEKKKKKKKVEDEIDMD